MSTPTTHVLMRVEDRPGDLPDSRGKSPALFISPHGIGNIVADAVDMDAQAFLLRPDVGREAEVVCKFGALRSPLMADGGPSALS